MQAGTHAKLDRWWGRWLTFCENIEHGHDPFLSEIHQEHRPRILGAFAIAVREREFSSPSPRDLVASMVTEAVAKVAEVLWPILGVDPRHDKSGNTDKGLSRLFRDFDATDPPIKQEKALPPSFYRTLALFSTSKEKVRMKWLSVCAFFFCMRSCEYSHVAKAGKTRPLCLRNIRFIKDGAILPINSPLIASADEVSVTFRVHKD